MNEVKNKHMHHIRSADLNNDTMPKWQIRLFSNCEACRNEEPFCGYCNNHAG